MIIRDASPGDADAMERCARRAYADVLGRLEGMPDVTGDMVGELTRLTGLVAWIDGRLAGFILLKADAPVTKIANLACDPDFAGRGVARALLDAAAELARAKRAVRLELVTHGGMTDTQAFYRHLGWLETGRHEQAVVFTKQL